LQFAPTYFLLLQKPIEDKVAKIFSHQVLFQKKKMTEVIISSLLLRINPSKENSRTGCKDGR
jgi:hypothetical protein